MPSNNTGRRAGLVAGVSLLLMAALSAFAIFGALGGLGTPGDAARATKAIADAEGLFRWGVLSLFVVVVLDVIVAAALLELFTPVNRSLARLAAWFRVAYSAVFLVAISQLVGALSASAESADAAGSIRAFDDIWHTGLVLFGVHLVLTGWLALRSGFVPRFVGILLGVAGLGYLADGIGAVLVSGYSANVAQFTFVGEVVLIVWLLGQGRRVRANDATANDAPALLAR